MPAIYHKTHSAPPRVLIVGGGIAGIVSAILLEQQGFETTLIEQRPDWKPVGGGITLTMNGARVLQRLGLMADIRQHANAIRNINITGQDGRLLSSFGLEEYTASYAGTYTILRSALHRILISRLRHTEVLLGTTFEQIGHAAGGVEVALENGTTDRYDLVIGCDGIHSAVRAKLFPNARSRFSGYASWRFVVSGVGGICHDTLTEMWGYGKRFGIVPLGDNTVHCFAAANTSRHCEAYRSISIESFRRLFSGFRGLAPRLLDAVNQSEDLMYNDLEDIHLPQWHEGQVVLLGDAAHGMTPNMTQGASLAIEDAYCLAHKLAVSDSMTGALAAFYHARKDRVAAIQRRSHLLGAIGQVENKVLCNIRNYCWRRVPDRWIQNDLKKLLINDVP